MSEYFPTSYAPILEAIVRSAYQIRDLLRVHPLVGHEEAERGAMNTSGDRQKPIDLLSHEIMVREVSATGLVHTIYSEEAEEAIDVKTLEIAPYIVTFDPLDGSSNIDCNVSVGTIFSIYHTDPHREDLPCENIVCAGYIAYGFATEMVVTFIDESRSHSISEEHPVHRYLLGEGEGNLHWLGTLRIPENHKKIYAVNEGNDRAWNPCFRSFIEERYKGAGYTQRYVASMVADVHRTLLYGGFFAYPGDQKNPRGKLRLLYECIPMAILVKNAGGEAVHEGGGYIWNLRPNMLDVHQKCPILLGSKGDVRAYIHRLS
jgi:fructose-1,6-bisphosphatase I